MIYNSHRVYHAKYKTAQSLLDHLFPKLIFTSSISTYLQFLYCVLLWHRTNILAKRKYFLKWLLVYERHLQAKETNLLKFWTVHLSNILGSARTSMILRNIHIENNTWVRGNTGFILSVERDISRVSAANEWDIMFNTRNKSGISKHTCIILLII